MKFKDILYNLRTKRGISQSKLATELNLSSGLIGMYESGKRMPSVEAQEAIADYFNVSLDYLMGRDSKSLYYIEPKYMEVIQKLSENEDNRLLLEYIRRADNEQLSIITDLVKRMEAYYKGLSKVGKDSNNENNEN